MSAVSPYSVLDCDFYKLAVELNNVGIQLLECRAYKSSFAVLRAAIGVMKRVVRVHQGQTPPPATAADWELLHEAKERFCQVQHEMVYQDNHFLHQTLGSPVRIDSCAAARQCHPQPKNADITSAVILFNYAMVHRWASHEKPEPEVQESALRLFKMAYSILSEKDTLARMKPQDLTANRIFLLLLTLNSLAQMQMERGKHAEASTWAGRVILLHRIVSQKEDLDFEEMQNIDLMAGKAAVAPAA